MKMNENKDGGMHAKEFLGINDPTSLEKTCAVPEVVSSVGFENLDMLRRCNSLPLFISSNVYCDWKKKNTSTVQNRFITNNPNRQSVNSTETTTFNYELFNLQTETKSLQELQIEVDALLEFRDLVIETFPDLRNKIISMSSGAISVNNNKLHSSPSLCSRSQSKKKKLRKEHTSFSVQGSSVLNATVIIGEAPPAFVSRSRSNSNSCKKEPKSGEGSGSVVQDSGFSTETTSSKDGNSASSTSGGSQGTILPSRLLHDSDDELLNLLDVIYRKTSRFRQKFSSMQNYERDKYDTYTSSASIPNVLSSSHFHRKIPRYCLENPSKESLLILRKERDKLLDKVAELESEMLEGRIKISHMEKQLQHLISGNSNLEEQLHLALSQNHELNSKLLHYESDSPSRKNLQSTSSIAAFRDSTRLVTSKVSTATDQNSSFNSRTSSCKDLESQRQLKTAFSNYNEPVMSGMNYSSELSDTRDSIYTNRAARKLNADVVPKNVKKDVKSLGKLDTLFSNHKYLCKVREIDSKKFAAILLETNTLELQRHLLTLTVQNQVLTQKLDDMLRSKLPLAKRLNGSKEEMANFKQSKKTCADVTETKSVAFEPNVKASQKHTIVTKDVSPSAKTCSNSNNDVSSAQLTQENMERGGKDRPQRDNCTNCARNQDNDNNTSNEYEETFQPPKRSKPSKIPLPGSKTFYSSKAIGYMSNGSSPPLTAIHKSLSYSTGNIFFKNNTSRINRQDSLVTKSRGSSSSFSTDSKIMSPRNIFITSPLPKIKRDSVAARVRQLDYLATSRNVSNSKINEKNPSEQLIAQNKLTKMSSSLTTSVVNTSPVTSPNRSKQGKKENNVSVAAKRSIVLRKETDNNSAVVKKIGNSNHSSGQATIGNNNNGDSNRSITNSSVNSSLAIDEQFNDVDIGRVRNFRSAILGWLKI